MTLEHNEQPDHAAHAPEVVGSNIILVGAMCSGKSTVGWLLSHMIGYGFIDLDRAVETRIGMPVTKIFEERGEDGFRDLETALLRELKGIRSHVIACGGGAIMRDENWRMVSEMGTTVWLNTPPEEIARRLVATDLVDQTSSGLEKLKRRPLLADLSAIEDIQVRHEKLTERMKALIGQRAKRYRQCNLTIFDTFSTPESTAALIRDELVRSGALKPNRESRPFDRWNSLS